MSLLATATEAPVLLEVRDLEKTFGSSRALRGVSMTVRAGEVHALLGPNGAGKSTLIKILSGVHSADRGSMTVSSARSGEDGRIGVVHQDLGLFDVLSVRDNFHLQRTGAITRLGFVAGRAERRATREGLRAVGLDIDPDASMASLSVGEKSLVAVARLLARDADVVILDEVTAALARKDSTYVLDEMRAVADRGRAVIVVSHRLNEIVESCDSVTMIRDGTVAYSGPTPSLEELHAMMNADPGHTAARDRGAAVAVAPGTAPVVALRGVTGAGIGPVDLELRAGEVVGLVGSLASGLYDIGHLVAGLAKARSGSRSVTAPRGDRAIAFLAEERRQQGLLQGLEVDANMSIAALRDLSTWSWVSRAKEREAVAKGMRDLDVRPADTSLKIESLSGGNQQKVLIGRAAMTDPDVYVLCEPTRGVDIATKHAIYRFIERVRDEGAAVLVITIDVDDALAVSDRIGVVRDGAIHEVVPRAATDPADLLGKVS